MMSWFSLASILSLWYAAANITTDMFESALSGSGLLAQNSYVVNLGLNHSPFIKSGAHTRVLTMASILQSMGSVFNRRTDASALRRCAESTSMEK